MTDGHERRLRTGVHQGGSGPHGAYQWNVGILDVAFGEAMKILNRAQYRHFALQVKELAAQGDPTHSDTVDVDKVESIHEIRDSGGILGGLNVRVFFGVDDKTRTMVVLGAIQKQNNGPTPQGDKVRMIRRFRKYQQGDFGTILRTSD